MRRIAVLTAFWFAVVMFAKSGTLTCDTTCLTRAASITTMATNALDMKAHIRRIKTVVKKVAHPRTKSKATK